MNERMRASYDQVASWFAGEYSAMPQAVEDSAAHFLSLLPLGAHLLDCGCGHGRDMAWFEARAVTVTGIDLSPGMLAQAARKVRGALLAMDMRSLSFPAGSFDGVWCCAALLHLPKGDVPAALREMRRVLKPNGALFIAVQQGIEEGWELGTGGQAVERYFARYSAGELEALLMQEGFEIQERRENQVPIHAWLQVFATPVS